VRPGSWPVAAPPAQGRRRPGGGKGRGSWPTGLPPGQVGIPVGTKTQRFRSTKTACQAQSISSLALAWAVKNSVLTGEATCGLSFDQQLHRSSIIDCGISGRSQRRGGSGGAGRLSDQACQPVVSRPSSRELAVTAQTGSSTDQRGTKPAQTDGCCNPKFLTAQDKPRLQPRFDPRACLLFFARAC
jgi:hypothetical protein